MYEPYDKNTANTTDRIAWALCQIIDDDAPMRWTRYRGAAICIARNPEVMANLAKLKLEKDEENRRYVPVSRPTPQQPES